jgi:hypothetical protein
MSNQPLPSDSTAVLRRQTYWLLWTIAVAMVVGRIWATGTMISWNDISRWATIRALVEKSTYVIGEREEYADGTYRDYGLVYDAKKKWDTGDKVLNPEPVVENPEARGREMKTVKQFYSSKPPLMPTVMAGAYWVLHHTLEWNFEQNQPELLRTLLILFNAVPFAIYLWLMSRLIEQWGRSDWSRLATFAACCFGTFLSTFQITLNNHTPAACFLVIGLYPLLKRKEDEGWSALHLAWAGWWLGWMVCNELPSLAFAGLVGMYLLSKQPLKTLLCFTPCFLLPLFGLVYTNYLAIGTWQPAYAQFGTIWYNYDDSPWLKKNVQGIDKGEKTVGLYILHQLIGHHGIFSLTPLLVLSLVGMIWAFRRDRVQPGTLRLLSLGTLGVFLIVFCFYLTKTESYNYGGWTSGLRWFFWFIPLFMLAMLPVMDALAAKQWGRGLALVLLAFSVISASYPWSNPWRHPWLYVLMEHWGWIKY